MVSFKVKMFFASIFFMSHIAWVQSGYYSNKATARATVCCEVQAHPGGAGCPWTMPFNGLTGPDLRTSPNGIYPDLKDYVQRLSQMSAQHVDGLGRPSASAEKWLGG